MKTGRESWEKASWSGDLDLDVGLAARSDDVFSVRFPAGESATATPDPFSLQLLAEV